MVSYRRPSDQDQFGRYWDALVRGASPDELERLAQSLDPDVIALVAQTRALRQELRPQPAFTNQLERDLMQAFALAQPGTIPLRTPQSQPQPPNGLVPPWRSLPSPIPRRKRWLLAQAAIALLLIVAVIGAYFSFVQREDRATAPIVATPTADATPAADWPMYRGKPARTGAMAGPGPDGLPVELWRFEAQGPASRSPAIAAGVAYLQSGDGHVYALDAATGAERWRADLGTAEDTPAIVGDTLYVNDGVGALVALDAATGSERWRFAESVAPFASPIVVNGVTFITSEQGRLSALDAATGEERWQYEAGTGMGRSVAVADGLIYLGTDEGAVRVVGAATGEERWRFESGETDEPARTPTVADGVVYVNVGATLYAFDAADGAEQWRTTFDGARPVTVAGDTLYCSGLDGVVYALDGADGAIRWTFDTGVENPTAAAPALVGDTLYAAGADRTLYALNAATGAERWGFPLDGMVDYGPSVANGVVYVSTNLGTLSAIGGSGVEQLAAPGSTQGTPVSEDAAISPATSAAPAGSAESPWQSTGGAEALNAPAGAAVDAEGNLWVVDAGNDQVQIIAADGTFLESWDGTSGGGERFTFLQTNGAHNGDIAFGPDGRIYVAEPGSASHRVQVFDRDRRWIATWGDFGTGDGQFAEPMSVAVDADGAVYVLDLLLGRVQKFDAEGNFLLGFGGRGEDEGNLDDAGYIAIDPQGNVLVAGYANHQVVKFGSDGTLLAQWGGFGGDPGQFLYPNDVATDAMGNIYVADFHNGRIQLLDPNGQALAVWDAGLTPSGAENWPYALTLDGAGNLYVIGVGTDEASEGNVQKIRVVPSLVPAEMATPPA